MLWKCSNFCNLTRYLTIYPIFLDFQIKKTREIAEVKNSSKTSEILWPHCSQESQFCCCGFQSDQSSFLVKSPNYQASVKTYRPKCQELKIDPLETHHKKVVLQKMLKFLINYSCWSDYIPPPVLVRVVKCTNSKWKEILFEGPSAFSSNVIC